MKKKKSTFKIIIAIILLLIVSIYIAGVYFFNDRILPRTYINGIDFGLTRISELEKNYDNLSRDFKLGIEAKDIKKDEFITSKDIKFEDKLISTDEFHQIPFYWPFASLISKDFTLDADVKYDENLLDEKIKNLEAVKNGKTEPQDAKVIFENGEYKIADEVDGNIVKVDELKEKIVEAFKTGEDSLNLEEENLYLKPKITSDSEFIKNQLASYQEISNMKIVYNFEDRKEELTGERVMALFSPKEDGEMVPDDAKVTEFVNELSKKYDTFKGTREFNATDIGKVRVTGGIYGWLTDIDKTKEELIAALNAKEDKELTPVYKLTANSRAVNDLGNTYIEVDLARQMLWLYKDGQMILKTNVVSGNPTRGNGTPTGTDKIWSRETDRYLTGEDYKSKVSYWLPINWSGVGLHDASWRGSFGGNNYKTNGSHGCVNIPPSQMPQIFQNTFNGMPVVVYDSSTQKVN
ncbi:L,D-transpeptidase family protein [Peptoniphilus sp.]|jgi:hypothetical protein|uniref:L,D-transpeptidase family protein n=1 Tax=Peptoniphilus sp. TaxID=1971214 RepID=UPI003D93730A